MKNALAFRHSAGSLNKMQKSYGKFANHTRKINIEKLVDLDVIDKIKLINLNKKTPYNREIDLKKIIMINF